MPTLTADRAALFPQRPARVLIIDDEAPTTRLLEFILGKNGYATDKAKGGRRCLTLAASFRPDAILLGVQMHDWNGMHSLQRLRRDPATAHTIVLALTSAFEVNPATLLEAGATAHCSKPIAPSTLLRKLRELGVPPTVPAVAA